MPQVPNEVEVYTVGVKHDYADGPGPHTDDTSRSDPAPEARVVEPS
jgi:hypothetical protein